MYTESLWIIILYLITTLFLIIYPFYHYKKVLENTSNVSTTINASPTPFTQ